MTRHPLAYEIALTITSTNHDVNDMEEAAYETLVRIRKANGWSESFAAELYSRIVEQIPDGVGKFNLLVTIVSDSLWRSLA